MPAQRDPIDRLVDLMIALPVSTVVAARRTVPAVGRWARRTIPPGSEIVDRAGGRSAEWSDEAERVAELADRIGNADPQRAADPVDGHDGAHDPGGTVAGSPLPIDDYDHLAARQVVDRLDSLTDDELHVVDGYERSHRHRQTVLRKIEQLTS